MGRNDNKHNFQFQKTAPGKPDQLEKVLMVFPEDKFYNDLTTPKYLRGEVYELEGYDWIARWMKRGGMIVTAEEAAAIKKKKSTEPAPKAIEPSQPASRDVPNQDDAEENEIEL